MERARHEHNNGESESKENAIDAAQKAYDTAQNAADDAERNYEIALTDLTRAKDDAASAVADKLKTAQNAVFDAQTIYDKAVADLDRAMSDAVSNAEDNLSKAADAVADAQRAYEKAAADKKSAAADNSDNKETKVESAQNALADSQMQLLSAQNNLESAQNSADQAASKQSPSDTNLLLQELNLEKLNRQLVQGEIVATASGVVTESNIRVGASPSGILFVIEDTDDLYISARVKEYNLSSIALGQLSIATAEAAEDAIYEAEVSYVSPKAVSEAGSTSVEFELKAKLLDPNDSIKIGMNAFIDIIAETKHDIYAVPSSSVLTTDAGSFVYMFTGEETMEVPVNTGMKTYTDIEIYGEALFDGMLLLTDPANRLVGDRSENMFPFGGNRF